MKQVWIVFKTAEKDMIYEQGDLETIEGVFASEEKASDYIESVTGERVDFISKRYYDNVDFHTYVSLRIYGPYEVVE